jgi:hypothetical protein
MKRNIFLLGILLLTTLMVGCDIETSNNGKLDGLWQVTEITYLGTNSRPDSVVAMKSQHIYWAFQNKLLSIRGYEAPQTKTTEIVTRFSHNADSLILRDFYFHYVSLDSLVTDTHTHIFNPIGVESNEAHFQVEQLTDNTLSLRSTYAKIALRKF